MWLITYVHEAYASHFLGFFFVCFFYHVFLLLGSYLVRKCISRSLILALFSALCGKPSGTRTSPCSSLGWVVISPCQMINLSALSRPLGEFRSHLCFEFDCCGVSDKSLVPSGD